MNISGGIVTYNNEDTIEKCILSVLAETDCKEYSFMLYILDNCSTDNTISIIERIMKSDSRIKLVKSKKNLGFGRGHNRIISKLSSDYHFVINPDIYLESDVIGELSRYIENHENIGLITPRILNPDGSEQYLPKHSPSIRYVFLSKLPGLKYLRKKYTRADERIDEPLSMEFCTGCFFGAKTQYIKGINGFDKDFFMYFEDADLSRRVLRDKKKIVFYPGVYAYHNWKRDNMGSAKGIKRFIRSYFVYCSKWGILF